jgi:putative membrane protein
MNISKCLVVSLFLGSIAVASADDKKSDDQPFDDITFVQTAMGDGMHEIELGKIADEKAKNPEVKKFAERMIKDHTNAGEGLKVAAKAANIPVPEIMDEKLKKHVEFFKNYRGSDFDSDYIKHMVKDHTEAVALFSRASTEAKNKSIRDFAAKTLPTVREHLELAKKLSK